MTKTTMSDIVSEALANNNWKQIETFFNSREFVSHLGMTVCLDKPDLPMCEIADIQPYHLGGIGQSFINGAIISAVVDLSLGLTGIKYCGMGNFATCNLNIDIAKPIENQRFYSIAKCNKKIGNKLFSEVTLFNIHDEPCVYATGMLRVGIKSVQVPGA